MVSPFKWRANHDGTIAGSDLLAKIAPPVAWLGDARYSSQPARSFCRMNTWRLCVVIIVALGSAEVMAENPAPKRDINAVLAAHDQQLLKLPGVVGVY